MLGHYIPVKNMNEEINKDIFLEISKLIVDLVDFLYSNNDFEQTILDTESYNNPTIRHYNELIRMGYSRREIKDKIKELKEMWNFINLENYLVSIHNDIDELKEYLKDEDKLFILLKEYTSFLDYAEICHFYSPGLEENPVTCEYFGPDNTNTVLRIGCRDKKLSFTVKYTYSEALKLGTESIFDAGDEVNSQNVCIVNLSVFRKFGNEFESKYKFLLSDNSPTCKTYVDQLVLDNSVNIIADIIFENFIYIIDNFVSTSSNKVKGFHLLDILNHDGVYVKKKDEKY